MISQDVDVVLAFGANQGDRGETIRAAQRELAATPGIRELMTSTLRETVALTNHGPDVNAPKYLNGVATLRTTLDAHALLDIVQALEYRFGRVRAERWGDRTLDIDIITYGGRVIADDRLTVPHPRAFNRDFVLSPWLECDPNAVLIGHGRVATLLEQIGDSTVQYSEGEDV